MHRDPTEIAQIKLMENAVVAGRSARTALRKEIIASHANKEKSAELFLMLTQMNTDIRVLETELSRS